MVSGSTFHPALHALELYLACHCACILEGLLQHSTCCLSNAWVKGVTACKAVACPVYHPDNVMLLGRACSRAQVVSVQYQVVDSQAFDDGHNDSSLKLAFYKLTNPHRQITSCVHGPC